MTHTDDWHTGTLGLPTLPLPESVEYRQDPDGDDEHAIFTSTLFAAEDVFASDVPRQVRAVLTLQMLRDHEVLPDGVRVLLRARPDAMVVDVEFTRDAWWWGHADHLEALAVTRMVTRVTRATWLTWHLTGLLGGDRAAVDAAVQVLTSDGAWADAVAAGWAEHRGGSRPDAA